MYYTTYNATVMQFIDAYFWYLIPFEIIMLGLCLGAFFCLHATFHLSKKNVIKFSLADGFVAWVCLHLVAWILGAVTFEFT